MLAPIKCSCYISLKKPHCQARGGGIGHMTTSCMGEHVGDTVLQLQHWRLYHITLSICASCNVFPERQGRKRYGYNDISVPLNFLPTFQFKMSTPALLKGGVQVPRNMTT